MAKSKPPAQTNHRHSRALQEAKESLKLVELAVAHDDMDALGDEILEGYGTAFGLPMPFFRAAAYVSTAEPVENVCRRSCRIGFKYNQILDTMVGEPLAGTIGGNGDRALKNAVRAIMHVKQQKQKIYDPEDDDNPENPDQDAVVDGDLLLVLRCGTQFRPRVAMLALAAKGFYTSVRIPVSGTPNNKSPALYILKRILDIVRYIYLHEDDVADLGLPARGAERQSVRVHIRLVERIDQPFVGAMGTVPDLQFLNLYDSIVRYGEKSVRLFRERHFLSEYATKLLAAFVEELGLAPLDSLDIDVDLAARIKSKRPIVWSDKEWKKTIASVVRRSVSCS